MKLLINLIKFVVGLLFECVMESRWNKWWRETRVTKPWREIALRGVKSHTYGECMGDYFDQS
jgi:hypothetical protein